MGFRLSYLEQELHALCIHCMPFQGIAAGPLVSSGLRTPLQNQVNKKQVRITGPVQSFHTDEVKKCDTEFSV